MRRIGILIAVVVFAACTSGGSTAGTGSTTTTPTKPAGGTGTEADRIAQAGLIRLRDLPAGYQAGAPTKSDDDAVRSTAACDQFPRLTDHGKATASSPSFFNNDSLVGNKVDVFATPAAPRALIEELRDPAIITCLHDLVLASLRAAKVQPPITSLDVSPIAVDSVGDDGAGFRFTVVTTTNGTPTTTLQDQVAVRVGRTILILRPVASSSGPLAELETTLIPKLVDRLRAAVAANTLQRKGKNA